MLNKASLKQSAKKDNKHHRLLVLFRQKAELMEAQYQLRSSLKEKSTGNTEK